MIEVTIFKQKPYSQEYTNPLTGIKSFRVMEYPPNHVDIDLVFDMIKQEKLKSEIDAMRSFYDTDHSKYSKLKGKLPICLFAGTFGRFCNDALIAPSGLVVVDFDKIPVQEMVNVWNMLVNDPYTYAAFLSPSGRGYKVIVRVGNNMDNTSHNEYLDALKEYYNSPFWDDSCKGISRACYLSSDPDLYQNRNSKTWTKRISSSPSSPVIICAKTYAPPYEHGKLLNFLEGGFNKYPMTRGNRHRSSFDRARELAEWSIPQETAFRYLSQFIEPDFSEEEIKREVRNAYKWVNDKGNLGSKYRKI